MEALMTLGETVRKHRRAKNLTLQNVGDHLGVTYQNVQKWEADKSTPSATQLHQLAKLFDVTTDELLSAELAVGNLKSILPLSLNQTLLIPLIAVNKRTLLINEYTDNESVVALNDTFPVTVNKLILTESHVVIEVEGDIMEPRLMDGSKVLAEAIAPENFPYEHAGIYAVLFGKKFAIRRIINNDMAEHGKLFLVADNKKYDPLPVEAGNIRAMWRVVRVVDAPIN